MELVLCTDGGSRGNPGKAGYGFVVYKGSAHVVDGAVANISELTEIHAGYGFLGVETNNVAEWKGLEHGLAWIIGNMGKEAAVQVLADSLLVVSQAKGSWKVKQEHLKPLYNQVKISEKLLAKVTYTHIYREYNKRADELANIAMDGEVTI